ncbi:PREDICTED: protein Wnt-4-like isoform X1 [Papilio polytes]|uniref:protein Wnt-4-like isoform X1 n=1 Tax=Papilio polytes TaxID=76194 RepID=UPI000675CC5C|nr:PREDICTED: protein Wnt-4-like isoform X1 [Papilio polytes]
MKLFWKVLCFFILFIEAVTGNWWNLAVPRAPAQAGNSSLETFTTLQKESCHRLEYLVERQKQLCLLSDRVLQVLQTGAGQAVEECQHQFRHSRWNCSTVANSTDIFGGVLKFKSRESAFVHALSSAALAHAVARACSRGELNECSCDARVRKRTPRHWQWGGCSEDIRYGEMFSRDFVDAKEDKDTDVGLMNLHNNEAGRRAVRSRMQRVCKCHGMSGSCSVRVCWRRLPQLRAVGDALATRYEGASHVKVISTVVERKRGKNVRKLRPLHADMKKPNKTDLVYLEESPDYCEPNDELGILGTRGRTCNRTSAGLDGCRLLCCGRGYQTRVRDHEEKCRCRFVWCCRVHCEVCRYKRDHHVCN